MPANALKSLKRACIGLRQWRRYGTLPRPGTHDLYRLPDGRIRPGIDRA